jgi:hypothetical protein
VHLPYRSQRLLLGQLGGPLRKAQPLAAHAHRAAADNDDIVACSSGNKQQQQQQQ